MQWWMIGPRQIEGPWVPYSRGLKPADGVLFDRTFKKLVDARVQSVLLYGAEVWGCLRRLESLEQVQLRAFRSYFGVSRSHSRTSLLVEMEALSVGWETRIRCILFWQNIDRPAVSPSFGVQTGSCCSEGSGKWSMDGEVENLS